MTALAAAHVMDRHVWVLTIDNSRAADLSCLTGAPETRRDCVGLTYRRSHYDSLLLPEGLEGLQMGRCSTDLAELRRLHSPVAPVAASTRRETRIGARRAVGAVLPSPPSTTTLTAKSETTTDRADGVASTRAEACDSGTVRTAPLTLPLTATPTAGSTKDSARTENNNVGMAEPPLTATQTGGGVQGLRPVATNTPTTGGNDDKDDLPWKIRTANINSFFQREEQVYGWRDFTVVALQETRLIAEGQNLATERARENKWQAFWGAPVQLRANGNSLRGGQNNGVGILVPQGVACKVVRSGTAEEKALWETSRFLHVKIATGVGKVWVHVMVWYGFVLENSRRTRDKNEPYVQKMLREANCLGNVPVIAPGDWNCPPDPTQCQALQIECASGRWFDAALSLREGETAGQRQHTRSEARTARSLLHGST